MDKGIARLVVLDPVMVVTEFYLLLRYCSNGLSIHQIVAPECKSVLSSILLSALEEIVVRCMDPQIFSAACSRVWVGLQSLCTTNRKS